MLLTAIDAHCEQFVNAHVDGTFFQSWAFGEFQEKIPYRGKTWALEIALPRQGGARNDIVATCLVIRQKLRGGLCWLWVPYGPLLADALGKNGAAEIFEDMARIAKEEKAVFARIEPPAGWPEAHTANLAKTWPIRPAKKRYTPEHTLILDLDKTEEEILAQMKPKGRYNIKVAEKHGITIKRFDSFETVPPADFDAFYSILEKTGERDKFGIHPKHFYETLLKTFGAQKMASLFLAYKCHPEPVEGHTCNDNTQVIAGIIVVFYKDTATYYYGASDYEHRDSMAPYLLQWSAIREAKKRGMKYYDFLGIAPPCVIASSAKQSHPWAGVTEFKKKFGGREAAYPKAFDIVYKPLLYKALKIF